LNVSSIVEFLTARLDEDEASARSGLESYSGYGRDWVETHIDLDVDNPNSFNAFDPAPAVYLRRFTPQRVLADIAAKRAIVRDAQAIYDLIESEWSEYGNRNYGHNLLQHLAVPYADHPDYQQEWAQ
jgi:hypothetical protein